MGRGRARIYNIISLIFVILAVIWIVYVILQVTGPTTTSTAAAVIVPTALVLPTASNTFTPSFTPTNTDTLTPTPTFTSTLTPTITPTLIASSTPVTPTDTPVPSATLTSTPIPSTTLTFTPVPSLTITVTIGPTLTPVPSTPVPTLPNFTPQPTQPPPSPFPFVVKDNQVIFTTNFANAAGCAWQGIGGQVFDTNGQPLPGIRVHVFGNGLDVFATSGSNTLYGPSGYEIAVANTIGNNTYLVELQTDQGTIIAPQQAVSFPSDCARNLALVNFQQSRPF